MAGVEPWIALAAAFVLVSCSHVLLWRRSTPGAIQRTLGRVESRAADVERQLVRLGEAEAERALAFARLQREVAHALEANEDVLERIDTKRRRIDASDARRRQREEQQPQEPQPVDLSDWRNVARQRGML